MAELLGEVVVRFFAEVVMEVIISVVGAPIKRLIPYRYRSAISNTCVVLSVLLIAVTICGGIAFLILFK